MNAERVLAQHSKSFWLASRLLPAASRDEAAIVYAYCRRADDAIDLAPTRAGAALALQGLHGELDAIVAGRPVADPCASAFAQVLRDRAIPALYPRELLEGMRMDAAGTHYETLDDLLLYCFRVAGTVGLMMCHVMGVREPKALRNACHLGIAMQLTNICRDVEEDWRLGRVYLPARLLADAGLPGLAASLGGPFPPEARAGAAQAVARLLELADRYYASGDEGVSALDFRCGLAIRAARLIYARIGAVLRRRACDVLSGRAVVSTAWKLALVARALWASLVALPRSARGGREALQTLQRRTAHDLIAL